MDVSAASHLQENVVRQELWMVQLEVKAVFENHSQDKLQPVTSRGRLLCDTLPAFIFHL